MPAQSKLPQHVAIIMDGNGRWAKQHKLSVALGHRQGVETLREIVRYSSDIGIRVLSLYAFSTENWRRSETEVKALMQLIIEFFSSEIDELDEKDVRIRILGRKEGLPEQPRKVVIAAEDRTAANRGLQLNIALNYGARAELLDAMKALMRDAMDGKVQPDEVQEEHVAGLLSTSGQPDVDLLIRTSGEMRLSNFLLWQCAYAEFSFPSVLWPDFTVEAYKRILQDYGNRERRFGGRVS